MTAEEIESRLSATFKGALVRVTDLTGTSDHFEAVVVSEAFDGLSRVRQHQAVYAALGDAMRQEIHALALKTFTPEAWEKQALNHR